MLNIEIKDTSKQDDVMNMDELKKVLPDKFHNYLNDEMLNKINDHSLSVVARASVIDNISEYAYVLQEFKCNVLQFLNAIKFSTLHIGVGMSQKDAYRIVFPDRHKDIEYNTEKKDFLSSYASMYARTNLVTHVMQTMIVPGWLIHRHKYDEAVQTAYNLMVSPKTRDRIRLDAADLLLRELKQPEILKQEIKVKVQNHDNSDLDLLNMKLNELSKKQQTVLATPDESNKMKILDVINIAEVEEVNPTKEEEKEEEEK